ncbi:MAG: hypothetical protein ABH835_04755 [Patescibacteria group bacterium]|nr:hypothetical protein [Patescibacteria group bacterium]
MEKKKMIITIAIIVGLVILFVLGASIFMYYSGPKHFIKSYFKDIEKDSDFVLEDTYEEFIIEDYEDYYQEIEDEWREADKITYNIQKDEGWKQEMTVTVDEDGDEIEEITKFKPYYQWLASNYRAWVVVDTDGNLETYVLEFKRKTDNEWNLFSYWTKPWVMYDIWYEDEYEDYISWDEEGDEFGEDFFEFDTGDIEDEEIEDGEEETLEIDVEGEDGEEVIEETTEGTEEVIEE